MKLKNQKLYQIDLRRLLRSLSTAERKASLKDIDESYWSHLEGYGIDLVWLMGIWSVNKKAVEKYCFTEDLKRAYSKALKDWTKEDVAGSPFAIDEYAVNPELGNLQELKALRENLAKRGMKLILDFVPNHLSAESKIIALKPEIFLPSDEEYYLRDSFTFFKSDLNGVKYLTHGRDPFFPAWQDTAQINFFQPEARDYLTETLLKISALCDGVRCDMAMLALNNVFQNTWGGQLKKFGFTKPENEFWKAAISEVRNIRPDFIFIAEAYWGLEWELQQQGFDFTYDKKLTDRMATPKVYEVKQHLQANNNYQMKSVRFIENHDEERAIAAFGRNKSLAAAVIISSIQGLSFYHDGQFEGKKIKTPVQLAREPIEKLTPGIKEFYNKLLTAANDEPFKFGEWNLLEPLSVWDGNYSNFNILAWEWNYNNDRRIVIVNFSEHVSQCRIKFDVSGYGEQIILEDRLNDKQYVRLTEEVHHNGLYVELKEYQSHIFKILIQGNYS